MNLEFELVATVERYPAEKILEYSRIAEESGFDAIGIPDHFHPWSDKYGKQAFSWIMIAVVAERTKRVQIGSCVTTPILRYHPGIVAQAFATLGYLYSGRIYLGIGSGEAMNEVPLGYEWPPPSVRIDMIDEALTIIKKLWSGKRVTFRGKYWKLNKATLYSKPKKRVPIYIAGTGVKIAMVVGKHGDGFITVPHIEVSFEKVFRSLRKGAEEVGRDPSKIKRIMHMMVSYDEDYDRALDATEPWNATVIPALYKYAVYDPVELDENGKVVGRDIRARKFLIITEPEQLIHRLEEFIKLGFTRFQFNNSSPDPAKFLKMAGKEVIPYLKDIYKDE